MEAPYKLHVLVFRFLAAAQLFRFFPSEGAARVLATVAGVLKEIANGAVVAGRHCPVQNTP
jgi:hypothetical protein